MPATGRPDDLTTSLATFRERALAAGCPAVLDDSGTTLRPRSADGVAECVRLAADCGVGIAVTANGVPSVVPADAIGLELRCLDRIVEFRPGDMLALVEPGATVGALRARATAAGLAFPPARLESDGLTIGELLARGGARGIDHGPTRDYALGLRFASAGGDVVSAGSRAIKNATGYSLTQHLLGTHHQLGIVVEATLRLAPALPASRTLVVEYPDFGAAVDAALAATPPDAPAAVVEALDPRATLALPALGIPSGRSAVLCLVEATDEASANARRIALQRLFAPTSLIVQRLVAPAAAERLWAERREIGDRLGDDRAAVAVRSAPRGALPALARDLIGLSASRSLESCLYGEVGAGSLTLRLAGDLDTPSRRSLVGDLARIAREAGATIVDLVGFDLDYWELADLALPGEAVSALRLAKRALDPNGLFRSVKR